MAEYVQCGGQSWSGATTCCGGLACYSQHPWYSQCLTACPAGWDCEAEGAAAAATATGSYGSSTATALGLAAAVVPLSLAAGYIYRRRRSAGDSTTTAGADRVEAPTTSNLVSAYV